MLAPKNSLAIFGNYVKITPEETINSEKHIEVSQRSPFQNRPIYRYSLAQW